MCTVYIVRIHVFKELGQLLAQSIHSVQVAEKRVRIYDNVCVECCNKNLNVNMGGNDYVEQIVMLAKVIKFGQNMMSHCCLMSPYILQCQEDDVLFTVPHCFGPYRGWSS